MGCARPAPPWPSVPSGWRPSFHLPLCLRSLCVVSWPPRLFLVTITSLWADFPGVVLGCPHVPVRGLRAGGWGRHWPAQVSDKHTEQPSSYSTWVSGGRAWDPLHRAAHGSALGHLPVWASQIWALSGAAWPVGPSLPGHPPGRLAARALAPLGGSGWFGGGGGLAKCVHPVTGGIWPFTGRGHILACAAWQSMANPTLASLSATQTPTPHLYLVWFSKFRC